METDRKEFIKKLIQEGKDLESVRMELISQGENTLGLEGEYRVLIQELGISEPKPKVPDFVKYSAHVPLSTEHASTGSQVPSILGMLGYGFFLARLRWKEVVLAGLITFLPTIVAFIGVPYFGPLIFVVMLLGIFLSVVASGALLYIFVLPPTQHVRFVDALQWALTRFFSLFWLGLLSTLIIIGGSVLLVLPGIIIAVYSVFACIALVKEDQRGMKALLRSADLVKGNFWKVLGVLAVFFLMSAVVGALAGAFELLGDFAPLFIGLVQMVFTAVMLGALVKLYEAYAEKKPLFDLSSYTTLRWFYRLLVLISLLAILAFGYFMSAMLTTVLDVLPDEFNIQGSESFVEEDLDALGFTNVLVQSKVETTAASAKLYHGRMGFYDGVCDDITVVEPVVCRNSSDYFMIFAPLADGTYYCTDSTNFSGAVERPQQTQCQ